MRLTEIDSGVIIITVCNWDNFNHLSIARVAIERLLQRMITCRGAMGMIGDTLTRSL